MNFVSDPFIYRMIRCSAVTRRTRITREISIGFEATGSAESGHSIFYQESPSLLWESRVVDTFRNGTYAQSKIMTPKLLIPSNNSSKSQTKCTKCGFDQKFSLPPFLGIRSDTGISNHPKARSREVIVLWFMILMIVNFTYTLFYSYKAPHLSML